MSDHALKHLMKAVAAGKDADARAQLATTPALARISLRTGGTRETATDYFLTDISHYIYAGDTALHVAAAAHNADLAKRLIDLGADVSAKNRRGATPLHYAADGNPAAFRWDPDAQVATIRELIASGADANLADQSSVTPLHRAIRNRCAAAVSALLDAGAKAAMTNGAGSTPMLLATRQTGRGGSGSPEAKAQQAEIIHLLERHGQTG